MVKKSTLYVLICQVVGASACGCTGVGHGASGLARGFPENYGTSCKAWDDGDCSSHSCGSLKTCPEIWPNTGPGTWCCKAWCYVDATCALSDVSPSTVAGSKTLMYSYQACATTKSKYEADTCPWQQEVTFEEAYAAIIVAEKVAQLFAHDERGIASVDIVSSGGQEFAVTAGVDAKLCVFTLRTYGGMNSFCSSPMSHAALSLTASSDWVAVAKDGFNSIEFWAIVGQSLSKIGELANAGTKPVRFVKYISNYGLLSSSEDGYVSVWDTTGFTNDINSLTETGKLGAPFTWAPHAMAEVTFGQKMGLAIGAYGDIEIWTKEATSWKQVGGKLSGHSRLISELSFLSSMGLLASASVDSTVALWHFKDGEWTLATYLYDHKEEVKSLTWIPQGPLLASGDKESLILWRPASEAMCEFSYVKGYYLPGFNRYVTRNTNPADCQKLCCENSWCLSFDFAYESDGKTHDANVCWLSTAAEGRGGGGLKWDPEARYDYYEITKRGTKFMSLKEPKGIKSIALAPVAQLLVSSNQKDGVLDLWKLSKSSCPDGQMAKGDGASCVICPLGRAGKGGSCPMCKAGTYAQEEGLTECTSCQPGWFNAGMGASKCSKCSPGRYSESPGASVCTNCGKGYINPKVGATSNSDCKQCEPGFYNDLVSAKECKKCDGGTSHDQTASQSKADCVTCPFCGTRWGGGSKGTCPVPKHPKTCANCPPGVAVASEFYCNYCPLGDFPDLDGAKCMNFKTGNFDAVPDVNNRQCYKRNSYANLHRPLIGSGWFNVKPKDTTSQRFRDLTDFENAACSSLSMMGALYVLPDHVNRMKGNGACPKDESLRELCEQTKYILNLDIDQREKQAQAKEAAKEHALRVDRCGRTCTQARCQKMCSDITEQETKAEMAFDVLPFEVMKCEVKGQSCVATCTSTRPHKTRTSNWNCWDVTECWDDKDGCDSSKKLGPILIEPRTVLPRCGASCNSCPDWEPYKTCAAGSIASEVSEASKICSGQSALIISMIFSGLGNMLKRR
eukprot:gnl/MRDRNA2_/MRDRNA2_86067_c0_seq1.p1 gnl/MRDRNA2_/MRDRNA2_86067_c0~~gnl/MRDRNA2_/MRDRNA2_86067_c0_seq1.p1  ORF type:complete len:1018 (+),score=138.11 gnl/MRDRNA2_/MRDRNA2_86067_c0_seq1:100-3153(+)